MKKSTTRRALFMSFASMFLCFTMLLGTTYAWFTDSVESDVNKIVAGNLDIELEYWNDGAWDKVGDKDNIFNPNAKWEPGHAEVVYLRVSNLGDLALKYLFSIDAVEERIGLTKDGKQIKLSDHLLFGIIDNVDGTPITADMFGTDRDAAIAAVKNPQPFSETISDQHSVASSFGNLAAKAENEVEYPNDTIAVVVWMPSTVGNEANHNGVNIPMIKFQLNLMATQDTVENDSFDHLYDKDAEFDFTGTGVTTIVSSDNTVAYEVQVRNNVTGAKVGSFVVPKNALKDGTTEIHGIIKEGTMHANLVADLAGKDTITYEVEVPEVKDGNTEPVIVRLRIPAGLDPSKVVLYHKDQPVTPVVYDTHTGYVMFETTSFSPFTIVLDADSEYVPPVAKPEDLPEAKVTECPELVNAEIEWGSAGGFGPDLSVDANPKLESVFKFVSPHDAETVEESPYADWYCDFYVKLDCPLGENQIFLGGNYGIFGWVGFHNGDLTLEANTEIPLLGSVVVNDWTYRQIASFVSEFTCGVGDVNDALKGATFTVMLRLTNPENEAEFYNVATITHTFN